MEEFLDCNVWPVSSEWEAFELEMRPVSWKSSPMAYPQIDSDLPPGQAGAVYVEEIERHANEIIGPVSKAEMISLKKVVRHELRVNRIFEALKIGVPPRKQSLGKRSRGVGEAVWERRGNLTMVTLKRLLRRPSRGKRRK